MKTKIDTHKNVWDLSFLKLDVLRTVGKDLFLPTITEHTSRKVNYETFSPLLTHLQAKSNLLRPEFMSSNTTFQLIPDNITAMSAQLPMSSTPPCHAARREHNKAFFKPFLLQGILRFLFEILILHLPWWPRLGEQQQMQCGDRLPFPLIFAVSP